MTSVIHSVGHDVQSRTLSTCLTLIATTIITYCFALRAFHVDFSPRALFSMRATKWLLLLLYIDSWAFIFLSGLLVNGIGTSSNPVACSMGLYACILLYCASKLFTYLFLLEGVYLVWPNNGTRWSSTAYKTGLVALLGFVVVIILAFLDRIAQIRDDGQCIIGVKKAASMTTLFVDLAVNILLTTLFSWPLLRSNWLSANLRRVASRTLIASFCTLIISATNLTILTILHGKELAWICLSSCSTDVLCNALVIFWLTRSRHNAEEQSSGITEDAQGRMRSDHGKNASTIDQIHLRSASGPASSTFNGKTHKTVDGGANKTEMPISVKVDLEGGAEGDEQYPYYSEVYDGSSQYPGSDRPGSPILASRTLTSSAGEKNSSSATQFNYPPLSPPPLSHHQQHQQHPHQRSHSIGFYNDKRARKSSGDVDRHSFLDGFGGQNTSNSNAKPSGIFERLGFRSASAKDDLARNVGLSSVGGGRTTKIQTKRRAKGDEENMKVTVTVTTHLENEDDDLRTDVEAKTNLSDN